MANPKREIPTKPTDAELAILSVLWRREPSTVRDVMEELTGSLLARIRRIVGMSSDSPGVRRPWTHLLVGALLLAAPLTCLLTAANHPAEEPAKAADKNAVDAYGAPDVKSADGVLGIRLRAKSNPVKPGDPNVLVATLRNFSDKPVTVLKLFGGPFTGSLPGGLTARGPKGDVKYIGPAVEAREIAGDDFFELMPGKEVEGDFAISSDIFSRGDEIGIYNITYAYSTLDCQYAKNNRELAIAFPAIERLWSGTMPAIRMTVTKADPAMIKGEIDGLSDPNEHARRNAASNLAMFGAAAKAAVDPLIRALSDKSDADLRMYAARALGAIGPDAHKAVPALRKALADRADFGSRFVRKEAAKALGLIGPKAAGVAVEDLLPLLGDDDLYVRRAASESLGQFGEIAIPGLIQLLDHRSPEVRYRATMALARMSDLARGSLEEALDSDSIPVRLGAAMALATPTPSAPPQSVPKLIERLQDQDPTVRRWVAAALARHFPQSKEATTALLDRLKVDDEFALEIVLVLSERASHEGVLEPMLNLLSNQPPAVRAQIIRAVGLAHLDLQSAAKAVPVLQEALNDPQLGQRAAEALFRIAPTVGEVPQQLEAYRARHKLDVPHLGYAEDLRLAVRNMDFEGPEYNFSTPEAVAAGRRIFANVRFVGKTKAEVLAILGDPKALSAYARARAEDSNERLVYCYSGAFKGTEYTLHFKDGRVSSVRDGAFD